MRAYLFPGQGSQSLGMGSELFELFSDYTQQADEILGYSIRALCTKDENQCLNKTQYTQPALYIVNALTYLKTLADSGQKPDYVAGHSLGEYSALFAAGVFDFATGLKLTQKRGELMSQAKNGSMAAVLGLQRQTLTEILKENELSAITIANYNAYQQLVISGSEKDIDKAKLIFTALSGVTFIPLAVSGAFHSSFMLEAQNAFAAFIQNFSFNIPSIPVIANINALPYHPAVLKSNLIQQITQSVQWVETIEYLQKKSVITFQEIGPGKVLSGLLKRIQAKQ